MGTVAQEAHELAGHPKQMGVGKFAAISIAGSTASTVAGYQLNRGLSRIHNEPPPSLDLSPSTGGTPSTKLGAKDAVHASNEMHRQVARKFQSHRKGGRKNK